MWWKEFSEYAEHLRLADFCSLRNVGACFLLSATTHSRDGTISLTLSFDQFVEFHARLARRKAVDLRNDLLSFLYLQVHRALHRLGVRRSGYDPKLDGSDGFFWKSDRWSSGLLAFVRAMDRLHEREMLRSGIYFLEDVKANA